MTVYRWTQPSCKPCWDARNPDRRATVVLGLMHAETCCFCGGKTRQGIYVRVDPATVPYPTMKKGTG